MINFFIDFICQVKYNLDLMSLGFRNLLLLALLCGVISSMSISSQALRNHNRHMIKIHQSSARFSHQQSDTDPTTFSQNILNIIDIISNSVEPNTPSIIQTQNLPTFAFDRNACDNLNDDQRKQILDRVKQTRNNINVFKNNLNDDRMSADADNSIQYLNVTQKLTNAQCSEITTYLLIGPTPYQTNINTKNPWILGGITMDDLVQNYINGITINNNATNCGNNTPFWNGFKCIACNDPKPIFNIATSECVACPSGQTFDESSRTCVDGGVRNYKPNAAAEPNVFAPAQAPEDALTQYMNTGEQPCPVDTPFVRDNVCIECPADKPYFNILAKECQNCPSGQVWNATLHQCVPGKPIATDVPLYTPRLVMNDNSTGEDWDKYVQQNENKVVCPADKPFWTGKECIQCPQLFNVISRTCVACEPGLSVHTDTHKCEPANRLEPSLKDLFNAVF